MVPFDYRVSALKPTQSRCQGGGWGFTLTMRSSKWLFLLISLNVSPNSAYTGSKHATSMGMRATRKHDDLGSLIPAAQARRLTLKRPFGLRLALLPALPNPTRSPGVRGAQAQGLRVSVPGWGCHGLGVARCPAGPGCAWREVGGPWPVTAGPWAGGGRSRRHSIKGRERH